MKIRVKHISLVVAASVAVLALSMTGCGDDSEIIQPQRTQIVNYLTSTLRLEEGDYDNVGGVYRYVAGNSLRDAGETDLAVVERGDSLMFEFEAYTFTNSPAQFPFIANRPVYYNNAYMYVEGWELEPKKIQVGQARQIMRSIDNALPECEVGDSVLLFLTSNLAYGDRDNGLVPPNTIIQYRIMILDIKKN